MLPFSLVVYSDGVVLFMCRELEMKFNCIDLTKFENEPSV